MYCGKYILFKDASKSKGETNNLPIALAHDEILYAKCYLMEKFQMDKKDIIKFEDEANVANRVEFCEQLIKHSILNPNDESTKLDKCEGIAEMNKNLGKSFVKLEQNRLAFSYLNSAISNGETNESMVEFYYERASLYFKYFMYEQCYDSIILAKDYIKLAKNVSKITTFKNRLKPMENAVIKQIEMLKKKLQKPFYPTVYVNEPQIQGIPELGSNSFVDKRISVKLNENYSVCDMIANTDLPVGETIIIEQNYYQTLIKDSQYFRCDFCFKECDYNLIPCKYCSSTMYCNHPTRNCQLQAWNKYHKYECQINEILFAIHPYKLIVRMLVTSFNKCEDVDEFIKFTNSMDINKFNGFTMNWLNRPHNYLVKLFYSQKTGESIRTNGDRFMFSKMAAYLYLLLANKTTIIQDIFTKPEHRNFLREFIYRSILICSMNTTFAGANSTLRFTNENQSFWIFGTNFRIFQPMFNHNCKANLAVLTYKLNKSIIYTQRPVKQGESLTIDYVRHYPVHERSDALRVQFNDSCDCIQDFENTKFLSYALRRPEHAEFVGSYSPCNKLYLANKETVEKLREICCQYLNEHDSEYPTYYLYCHCLVLEKCLQRLYGTPIRHDHGTEQYFNYFNSFWTHGNEKLNSVIRQFKGSQKCNDKMAQLLFEFVDKTITFQQDAYLPRIQHNKKELVDEQLNITEELKYFTQLSNLPDDYEQHEHPDLVYALIMLKEILPKWGRPYQVMPLDKKYNDQSELIKQFLKHVQDLNYDKRFPEEGKPRNYST